MPSGSDRTPIHTHLNLHWLGLELWICTLMAETMISQEDLKPCCVPSAQQDHREGGM
jgi:hypothetical protein